MERPNLLAGLALARCEDQRGDADWLRARWREARVLLLDASGDALCDASGAVRAVPAAELPDSGFARACFLGLRDGQPWFALPLQEGEPGPADARFLGLRRAAVDWPAADSGLFAYARALALWQARHRHCGRCGAANRPARAGHVLRCSDEGCGTETFPRLDPAIIVLVTDGERCLLGRQAAWPAGQFSTLAGFVEPGESLEDAVRREVQEEAGVRVGACRYQSSQPWPFPSSLMLGFRAEALDPAIRLGDELEDARWFPVDALLAAIAAGELRASSPISIAHRLLREWVQELRGEAAATALAGAGVPR